MTVVAVRVLAPYNRNVLAFVLKILTMMLVDRCFDFQMFYNCRCASLSLSIFVFTSALDSPCLSMMLIRYVKVSSASITSSSSVIILVLTVFYFGIFLYF